MFFRNFSPPLVGQRPILESIDGGFLQTTNESFGYNSESASYSALSALIINTDTKIIEP